MSYACLGQRRGRSSLPIPLLALVLLCWLTPTALLAASDPILINCGYYNKPIQSLDGRIWSPDQYYKGGDALHVGTYSRENQGWLDKARVGRYGDFSYQIPVEDGSYQLKLYFVELEGVERGWRIFDVVVNGQIALKNLDILAEVNRFQPLVKTFPVTVTNGKIEIRVERVTRFGILSAIEILPGSNPDPGSVQSPTLSLSPSTLLLEPGEKATVKATVTNASASDVAWTVTPSTLGSIASGGVFTAAGSSSDETAGKITAYLRSSPAVSDAVGVVVNPREGPTQLSNVVRINVGNPSETYVDPNGNEWRPDQYYDYGNLITNMWLPTDVRRLLGMARFGLYRDFSYRIPVPVGRYNVALNFVELKMSAPGQRIFHVTLNGKRVLTNLDILTEAPILKTLQKVFTTDAPAGLIEIGFEGVRNGGIVSAIEVVPEGTAVSAPLNAAGGPPPPTDNDPATISLSTSSVSLIAEKGASSSNSKTVSVTNGGSGSLDVTLSADKSWVQLSPTSGSVPLNVTVSAAPGALGAGVHQAQVKVTAPGIAARTISVSLNVTTTSTPPPTTPPPTTSGNQFYVAPHGKGDGSIKNPWDMATALAHPAAVKPGDTIWVRAGVYEGPFRSYLKGAPGKPIILRAYPGERATIDTGTRMGSAALEVRADDAWYWGLEIMSSNPNRITSATGSSGSGNLRLVDGVNTFGVRCKFINLIIHDTRQGYGLWEDGIDNEVYGNLIYYNGWSGGDRGHGHGIYSQNRTGIKRIADNIQFKGYAMGIRAYGSSAAAAIGYRFDGNISFESGYLHGGSGNKWANFMIGVGSGARDIVVDNTYTYMTPSTNDGYSWLGWEGSGRQFDLIARNNWWIGGEVTVDVALWDKLTYTGNVHYTQGGRMMVLEMLGSQSLSNYVWDKNSYFGNDRFIYKNNTHTFASWRSTTGLDKNSTYSSKKPSGVKTFVRPNAYEEGRANIVVYNFDELMTVPVDVSNVLKSGDRYEVRDAQNYFGAPVLSGVYDGKTLPLPMYLTEIAQPSGSPRRAPVHTGPDFNVFVLLKR